MSIAFRDLLYGRIELPDWIGPFLRMPEFVRLRGVRLSNVDSIEFKDLANATRWEHGIGVAYLAVQCAKLRKLDKRDSVHLVLAALLHDVGTPPFAHTAELALPGYNHELETSRLLNLSASASRSPSVPTRGRRTPQFIDECMRLSKALKVTIDPAEVARLILGEGETGFLISGTLDLDNADNVLRGCRLMGLDANGDLGLDIARWLAVQDSVPLELESSTHSAVRAWVSLRRQYYTAFFEAHDQELARQALLQHLFRRSARLGVPLSNVVWSTDDEFIAGLLELARSIERVEKHALLRLVDAYRNLDELERVAHVSLESADDVRTWRAASAAAWLEERCSTPSSPAFLFVGARRTGATSDEGLSLFPPSQGFVAVYKLKKDATPRKMPSWVADTSSSGVEKKGVHRSFSAALSRELRRARQSRPWTIMGERRRTSVRVALSTVTDWSFYGARNTNIHAHPGTFVRALPSAIISALQLRDELIVDPFGGIGNTALEALRQGNEAISSDANAVASLAATARFTWLSRSDREVLRSVRRRDIEIGELAEAPEVGNLSSWHHPATIQELRAILGWIRRRAHERFGPLLLTTFSAILPALTERKGLVYTFFADNTPLPAGRARPAYADAIEAFLSRLGKNLTALEREYAFFERSGQDTQREYSKVRVLRSDCRQLSSSALGIGEESVAAIVTSPPYLCMADYTLGHRLSYYWLFPDLLESDFAVEIGARRRRSHAGSAIDRYLSDMLRFLEVSRTLLSQNGILAVVLGQPSAKQFAAVDVFKQFDALSRRAGFTLLWKDWREIHWHRATGLQHLERERISVYRRGS